MLLPSSFEDAPAHEAPPPGPWGSVKNAFGIVPARQKEEHVLQSCQPKEDLGTAFGNAPARQFWGRNRPRSITSTSMKQ